ncbi:GNAT family N-acetyltransferase [Robertkochia solimangrovi]|uniref:GNAT family N-acetyltransferase n=1 Tax=Robertkochia solimangrovi TaxID=2213046 RepID=UPI00117F5020|nr:N-acetyltransferase [Robertkochia solimangrovi]TRZ42837.1 N-acetyltransferase [Robertkochia solimangrovi]
MHPTLRQETPADYPLVHSLIERAFRHDPHSDHREQFLVRALREAATFIPELSLVAELNQAIVGYILFTPITIDHAQTRIPSLALAPVCVAPDFQRQGIGSALIETGHRIATDLGYTTVIVLGHKDYYPRFGYERCVDHQITMPFAVADDYCMVKELTPGALTHIHGSVTYPKAFLGA